MVALRGVEPRPRVNRAGVALLLSSRTANSRKTKNTIL